MSLDIFKYLKKKTDTRNENYESPETWPFQATRERSFFHELGTHSGSSPFLPTRSIKPSGSVVEATDLGSTMALAWGRSEFEFGEFVREKLFHISEM